MPKLTNKIENKYYEQFIIIKTAIESNKQEMKSKNQDSDEKMTQLTVKFETMLVLISNQLNALEYSPTQKDTLNPQDITTVVPANRRAPTLEGLNSTKIGVMWTLKHDISSPKIYQFLINTELKGYTVLNLKNFYKHIKICLNAVNRI